MVPRSVEISPSIAEGELLTSEPALIESRILADPTAHSINSRMGSASDSVCANCSSCVSRPSSSEFPPARRRSSLGVGLVPARPYVAPRASARAILAYLYLPIVCVTWALCVYLGLCPIGWWAMLYSPECVEGEFTEVRIQHSRQQ
jgi:hypothetical protein